MYQAFKRLVAELGNLFFGLFFKQAVTTEPTPPAQSDPIIIPPPPPPVVVPPPPVVVPPVVVPVLVTHGPQSSWWDGELDITQAYGCTDFATEGHNPNHPECQYFHEGVDFGKYGAPPCGKPIFSGGAFLVAAIDPPGYGPVGDSAAILLRGTYEDVWLYHMADYAVSVGERLYRGQLIGHIGTRGWSTGCHLHFEVRPVGGGYRSSKDPWSYIHEQY